MAYYTCPPQVSLNHSHTLYALASVGVSAGSTLRVRVGGKRGDGLVAASMLSLLKACERRALLSHSRLTAQLFKVSASTDWAGGIETLGVIFMPFLSR